MECDIIDDDGDDECETRGERCRVGVQNGDRRVRAAGVWQSGRVLRGQEVPLTSCLLEVDFVWFRGGSVVPPFWLLWQGAGRVAGGVVGTNQRIYIQGAVGEVFHPAWRSPGGLEECRHHGEG